jgi:hypothetical protein
MGRGWQSYVAPKCNRSILIHSVSLLETEFSNGQMHSVLVINFQSPLGQEFESGHRPRNAGAEVGPHAMAPFLALEDRGEHRHHGCQPHPRVPGATRTDWQGDGVSGLRVAPRNGQDDYRAGKWGNQRLKMRVVAGGPVPGTKPSHWFRMKPNSPPQSPNDCSAPFGPSGPGCVLPAWAVCSGTGPIGRGRRDITAFLIQTWAGIGR